MDRKELLELQNLLLKYVLKQLNKLVLEASVILVVHFSIADALAVLYGKVMNIRPTTQVGRPRCHGLFKRTCRPCCLLNVGAKRLFPMEMLETLNQPGTKLPSHCDRNLTPGVDMTTGSLGQGVSTALGMALAQKLDNKDSKTYLFIGDGECNEGQVWEGAMFAHQHKLGNLVAFVDDNGKQLDGYTKDVMDVGNIAAKFESFGWEATTIDGHDIEAIVDAIEAALKVTDKPSCIVLKTVKGKGVKDLEDMMLNHHVRIDDDFTNKGLAELEEVMAGIEKELANVKVIYNGEIEAKAHKDVFGNTLAELAAEDKDVVYLDADLMNSSDINLERKSHCAINCGISEANMMGVAAGLSAMGKKPFCSYIRSFCFQTLLDQVFLSIAYAKNNVRIYGSTQVSPLHLMAVLICRSKIWR